MAARPFRVNGLCADAAAFLPRNVASPQAEYPQATVFRYAPSGRLGTGPCEGDKPEGRADDIRPYGITAARHPAGAHCAPLRKSGNRASGGNVPQPPFRTFPAGRSGTGPYGGSGNRRDGRMISAPTESPQPGTRRAHTVRPYESRETEPAEETSPNRRSGHSRRAGLGPAPTEGRETGGTGG